MYHKSTKKETLVYFSSGASAWVEYDEENPEIPENNPFLEEIQPSNLQAPSSEEGILILIHWEMCHYIYRGGEHNNC